jgi:hypothetical protein
MDRHFDASGKAITSRAVAVSCYLFVEELYLEKKTGLVAEFSEFFVALLDAIKENLSFLTKFQRPENTLILDGFQKYVAQASVEPYAIRRRHEFLQKAFQYYRSPKGKGKIITKA